MKLRTSTLLSVFALLALAVFPRAVVADPENGCYCPPGGLTKVHGVFSSFTDCDSASRCNEFNLTSYAAWSCPKHGACYLNYVETEACTTDPGGWSVASGDMFYECWVCPE
jgi:hypothetical protein